MGAAVGGFPTCSARPTFHMALEKGVTENLASCLLSGLPPSLRVPGTVQGILIMTVKPACPCLD